MEYVGIPTYSTSPPSALNKEKNARKKRPSATGPSTGQSRRRRAGKWVTPSPTSASTATRRSTSGKLQTAGYKQAVEKWDTDSDSDSSDEEDLKM